MRVLVLGNFNSHWEKEFIQYVLLPLGAKVFFHGNSQKSMIYNEFYAASDITLIPIDTDSSWITNLPKIRVLSMLKQQKRRLFEHEPFDMIVIMYVTPITLYIALSVMNKNSAVYPYFYGSDIIRASKWACTCLKIMLKRVTHIIYASSSVRDAYFQKIGIPSNNNQSVIRLGISNFNLIDIISKKNSKEECKSQLGINPKKTTICVGYNGTEAQNHVPVIQMLKSLNKVNLDKIVLLLPVTYGGTQSYISEIESLAEELGCEYRVFKEYMDGVQISHLRIATDIFINAQITDGLSASVLEALYSGAILFNASWLHYKEYDEWGIECRVFSTFEEIITLIIESLDSNKKNVGNNREALVGKMSWGQCREMWADLFR